MKKFTAMKSMTTFPVIETERTRLRQLRLDDVDALFEIYSDAGSMRYRENAPFTTREEAMEMIVKSRDDFDHGMALRWAVEEKINGTLLGTCLWKMGSPQNEVGYSIGKQYRRRGFMFEVLKAMVDYLFYDRRLEFVTAKVKNENVASHALLLKTGFEVTGRNEKYTNYLLRNN